MSGTENTEKQMELGKYVSSWLKKVPYGRTSEIITHEDEIMALDDVYHDALAQDAAIEEIERNINWSPIEPTSEDERVLAALEREIANVVDESMEEWDIDSDNNMHRRQTTDWSQYDLGVMYDYGSESQSDAKAAVEAEEREQSAAIAEIQREMVDQEYGEPTTEDERLHAEIYTGNSYNAVEDVVIPLPSCDLNERHRERSLVR